MTKKKEQRRLAVRSAVKEYVKDAGFRSGDEALGTLEGKIAGILSAAIERCKASGRQTLKEQDF